MNLFLIRHGQSIANESGIIQGTKDFPLSPLGEKQVKHLGEFLSSQLFDYIYSSDLSRAHQTAEAISAYHPLEVIKWEKIREINLGPLEGKTRQEIYLQFPELKDRTKSILTTGIPGTETVEDLTVRCRYVLQQLHIAHKNKNVALVSHGGFISIFLMYLMFGDDWYTNHRPFVIGNTGITKIEFLENDKPIFHYINNDAHLLLANMHQENELY